jgi:hypothetical protein
MGCDIHTHAERRGESGQWEAIEGLRPFDWRSYGLYGWLGGVRNYSALEPIAARRGVPDDLSEPAKEHLEKWSDDYHSASWVSLEELTSFDYDALCEDRRCTVQIGPNTVTGAGTCEPGEGLVQSYREFLGEHYFAELEKLKSAGVERIIFWFDN